LVLFSCCLSVVLYLNCILFYFWLFCSYWWSHLSHWAWNKGYHRYRQVCFIPWPTPRNWRWGAVRNETLRQKRWFQFPIVNFPCICSSIPAAPAYGVYISQLIRYSRACGSYQEFLDRGLLLTRNLLNRRFLIIKLKSSLRKFYGRHHDLVDRYTDMFHLK
jgi:hypothetical protein